MSCPEHEHHGHEGHGHEHSHGHGHGHKHHAYHTHEHHSEDGITITEHEGALIATVELKLIGAYDEIERDLAKRLERLARMIEDTGGVIGHIKASLFGGGMVSTLSTTGSSVAVSRGTDFSGRAEVAAIVLAISEERLYAAVANCVVKGRT
ncbi:MAG: hypothetical protein LBI64_07265 [Coriobacteriales bacterium]|jgi:hypothetical protein|nr:hypothetical protein [Coriobacteriales bacterium]